MVEKMKKADKIKKVIIIIAQGILMFFGICAIAVIIFGGWTHWQLIRFEEQAYSCEKQGGKWVYIDRICLLPYEAVNLPNDCRVAGHVWDYSENRCRIDCRDWSFKKGCVK